MRSAWRFLAVWSAKCFARFSTCARQRSSRKGAKFSIGCRKASPPSLHQSSPSSQRSTASNVSVKWVDEIALTTPACAIRRCRAQAEKRAKHFADQTATKRHKLRIALKKLRYTAELFAGLYETGATKLFIQRLKRLQDDLGDANDVRVARDIVDSLTPSGRRATGIAHAGRRMLAWHKERIAKNEANLRQHLDELLAAPAFWQPTTSAQSAAD